MRAIKTSSVSFGLVNVPVKLYKAVESHDISFKQYHGGCGGGIAMERKCRECEQPVAWEDIVKGIDHGGTLVIIDPAELKDLEDEQPPAVEVVQFIDVGDVDPLYYEDSYYLAPASAAALEGYALLRHVLDESGRAALVRYALRSKVHMGVLRPVGKTLVIHSIAWPDEVRDPAFPLLDKEVTLKPHLVEMAHKLVDSMAGTFKPEEWVDTYADRLAEFIVAKAEGGDLPPTVREPEPAVDDLLAALEASIAKKKGGKPKKGKAA